MKKSLRHTRRLYNCLYGTLGLLLLSQAFKLSAQEAIHTDFSDGTWGEVVEERPVSGDFPSFEANGFTIRKGVLNTGSLVCPQGAKHINRIALDKDSERAYLMLPELTNVGLLEIHATTGSDDKSFVVQRRVGRQWESLGTYATRKGRDSIYVIPLHLAKAQVRILNNTGSTLFIWQVKTTVVSDDLIAQYERQRPLVTNFLDGTWGRPSSKKPESGQFPSSEANGFVLHQAYLASGSISCSQDKDDVHSGRIILDKDKTGAYLALPELEMVGEVEIHASTGSDDRSFVLQDYDGKRWKTLATFSTGKEERVYTYPLYQEKARLRIANNTGSALSIYQVKVFKTDAEGIARQEKMSGLVTNFNDGTWGEVFSERPESGDYPTYEANGFWIYSGILNKSSQTCVQGGKHYNRIVLDKDQEMGRIDFPEMSDVGAIEIHASTGSDDKSFEVLLKDGIVWKSLGIFSTTKQEQVYTIPVNREQARLRIRNNTSSSLNIYQIKMHTMTALNSLRMVASLPAQDELVYGNLTRKLFLEFNKVMTLGDKTLRLNGEAIDPSHIKVKANIASIRVKLNASNTDKMYTLDLPQGAFVSDLGVESEKASLSFKVHKTVQVPDDYMAELDAIYSNANILQNRVDVYYPKATETPVPVVINIHGGGWNHGEKESQTSFDFYFKHGIAVANMEYRMSAQALAPAAVEDVRCLLYYLANNAARFNIDPHKIILRGESAGAHLALTAAYLEKNNPFDNCSFKGADFTVVAVLDNYGPTDLLKLKDYRSLREWLGPYADNDEFIKSISPIQLVNENTPPTYILHGDADKTIAYEQSLLLEAALKAAGVNCFLRRVPGGKHGDFSSEYRSIIEEDILHFLSELNILPK